MNINKNVSAIIPASGLGKRFGISKIRAKFNDKLFPEIILEIINSVGLSDYRFIVNNDDYDFACKYLESKKIIINKNLHLGMIHSIELGLRELSSFAGYLIFPVDHPFIKPDTITKLIHFFWEDNNVVIKPSFNKKSGHPIIIPKSMVKLITNNKNNHNLKQIIIESNIEINYLDVDDENILLNVNTNDILETQLKQKSI